MEDFSAFGTGSRFVTSARPGPEHLRYAEACLKQGMSYAAAARSAGVSEISLRDYAPGYTPKDRPAPDLSNLPPLRPGQDSAPTTPALGACAAVLPAGTPEEYGQVAALALGILYDRCGILAVRTAVANIMASIDGPKSNRVSARAVANHVATLHGLTFDDLRGPRQNRSVARPRQIAMYAIKMLCQMSYPAIGRMFGGRDHTTVLHGVRKIEELIGIDPDFALIVSDVLAHFRRATEE